MYIQNINPLPIYSFSQFYQFRLQIPISSLKQVDQHLQVMATSRMIAVKSIDKKTKQFSVNVRILRQWELIGQYGKKSTEMILVDQEGSKIQATIPIKLPSQFTNKFQEGKMLKISKFGVEENCVQPLQKAILNHKWKLCMSLATNKSVQIPNNSFEFTPFQTIGCLNLDFVVDVIGEVILPLRDFEFVQRFNARKLDVQLIDNDGNELTAVLWASFGDKLKQYIDNRGQNEEGPVILVLQFVMLSTYQGKTKVSTMKHASIMHINASFPEVADYLSKRETGASSVSRSLTITTNDSSRINSDLWLKKKELKTIGDLLTCTEVGVYFVLATISDVDSHATWYYDGCSNIKCAKGLEKSSKNCPKCKTTYGNAIPRFKIRILVTDMNDIDLAETHFILFDATASSLLGMSAPVVLADVSEGQLPESFRKMFERRCLFRIDVDQRTVDTDQDKRTFTVKQLSEDTDIIAQFLSLINDNEVASKLNHGIEIVTSLNCNNEDKPLESVCDSSSTSITPQKRLLDTTSNDEEIQLSVMKGIKQIKQEELDK